MESLTRAYKGDATMTEEIYARLREFLDTLPAGYPASPTGVEIKILKKLFTPEQAALAMKLKSEPESVPAISERIGTEASELADKLEEMAQQGLIFRVRSGDEIQYQAAQFMIGIYEFQLKNLDREFSELFEEYLPYWGAALAEVKTSQIRIVPVESSVKAAPNVEPYNRIRNLVKDEEVISLQECICKKEQGLLGNPCDRPREVCIGFGDFAQFYIDNKMAKKISVDEALKVLDLAEASGLVVSPMNSQKLAAICCCCTCCCPNLKFAKLAPRPADLVTSYYQAAIDADLCTLCGECIERCQMNAIREGEQSSEVVDGRCIGCGLCVSVCPTDAISMVAKPGMGAPPTTITDMMNRIGMERTGLGSSE